MEKSKKNKGDGDATLESLRIAYTELSQEQFVARIGLNGTTYRRWLTRKTPPKLTPAQIASICHVCQVPFETFFEHMGANIDEAFGQDSLDRLKKQSELLSEKDQATDIDSLEMTHVKRMVVAARNLNVSLKELIGAFGIDTAGVPDDCQQPDLEQSAPPEEEGEAE